jgi:hypothetical protein
MPFYTTGITGYVDVRDVARAWILLLDNRTLMGTVCQNARIFSTMRFLADGRWSWQKAPRLKVIRDCKLLYLIFFAG